MRATSRSRSARRLATSRDTCRPVAPKAIRTSDIYWGAIPFLLIQLFMVVIVLSVPQIVLRDPPPDASSVKEIQIDVDPDGYYLPAEWR